jgi:hypothetical protein
MSASLKNDWMPQAFVVERAADALPELGRLLVDYGRVRSRSRRLLARSRRLTTKAGMLLARLERLAEARGQSAWN